MVRGPALGAAQSSGWQVFRVGVPPSVKAVCAPVTCKESKMTKRLFLIAGAAMGLGVSAQAQTMDQAQATRAEILADASGRPT